MLRWVIWTVVVVGWTAALEVPVPAAEQLPGGELLSSYRYLFAKSVHVAMYALMTVLSAWIPLAVRHRALVMFFLMAHAAATELLQELLHEYCHRGGSLTDVGLDHLGIAIGVALTWKRWTRADTKE